MALLEAQFDRNMKFKSNINTVAAKSLRSEPVGKDKLGNIYWCIMDRYSNIKIFQENADEETWRLVASDREEVKNLIHKLKMNDMDALVVANVMDEDTSSNSASVHSDEKNNVNVETKEHVIDINGTSNKFENNRMFKQHNDSSEDGVSGFLTTQTDKKIIEFENTVMDKNESLEATKQEGTATSSKTTQNENHHPLGDDNHTSTHANNTDNSSDNPIVGPAVVEPILRINGEGSGKECETAPIFSDVIDEPVFYVYGLGNGVENEMGNIKKTKECNPSTGTAPSSPFQKLDNIAKETMEKLSPSKSTNLPLKKKINNDYSNDLTATAQRSEIEENDLAHRKNPSNKDQGSPKSINIDAKVKIENAPEEENSMSKTATETLVPNSFGRNASKELNDYQEKNQSNPCSATNLQMNMPLSAEKINKTSMPNNVSENESDKSASQETIGENVILNECKTTKKKTRGKKTTDGIDISLIINDNLESGPPIRQSRRIAQQKIKEETNRRLIEEKMLREMKAEALKKKKKCETLASDDEDYVASAVSEEEDEENSKSNESKAKKKKSDKPWMTSSSESSSESEPEEYDIEPEHSDGGRQPAKSDHEFSPESDLEDDSFVPTRRARTVRAERYDDSDDHIVDSNEEHACQKCGQNDHPEWILLCDSCDKGYHCSCLVPVLFVIPEGDWFCPICQHDKLIRNLHQKLQQYDEWYKIYEIQESERILREKQIEEDKKILDAQFKKQIKVSDRIYKDSDINIDQSKGESDDSSSSSESNSRKSSGSDEDDIPIYKLRRRNQITTSYRFNEYDDLINSAITRLSPENESDDGFVGGKDIRNIIAAEKRHQVLKSGSASPVVELHVSRKNKKKKKKLNNLDALSDEDDGSDEDFKESSSDEEDESYSASEVSESSLELGYSRKQRAAAKRKLDKRFINDDEDESDESTYNIRKRISKNKTKIEDSEEFDEDDDLTESEEIDSADLCSDTETDSSENSNRRKKTSKSTKNVLFKNALNIKKRKKVKRVEDKSYKMGSKKPIVNLKSDTDSSDDDNVLSSIGKRKTRGKKLHYILDDEFESSDDGIRPGVHRPDTPPEEREQFIKKQEEIKRMLAEKNAAAAKELATPKHSLVRDLTDKSNTSLFNIPPQVIESAKVLDIDFLKSSRSLELDENEEDLDVNFPDPDDVNEEELAKIMEDEDFAQHQLKLDDEDLIRSKSIVENSPRKKGRDFESIDPTEITKSVRNMAPSKDAPKCLIPISEAAPILNSERVLHSFNNIIPQETDSSSLLQQMKQQAIPLNESLDSPPVLNSDRIFASSSVINYSLNKTVNTQVAALPVLESKEIVDVRRRRRKKITPLRNDLYRGILNGPPLNQPKPIMYHNPLVATNSSNPVTSDDSSLPFSASKPNESTVYATNPEKHAHLEHARFSTPNTYSLPNYSQNYCHTVNTEIDKTQSIVLEGSQPRQSSPKTFTTLETVRHDTPRPENTVDSIQTDREETECTSEFSGLVSYFSSQQNELNA
ncbi:remodeling and spacing factor 1-like isoform X2 [Uranotaenia lowii]|uniref:remodeling and spacing factor 1-like isoform X2 n=1 Tax=Uranotaenia lowii TaxID=190385 RepID=UPI0024795934|nr:remodeling and spacing factor 1-like isoform X2 [Uranotaenia lowii]